MRLNNTNIPKLGGKSVNSQEEAGTTKTPHKKPPTPLQEVQAHTRSIWAASLGRRYLYSKQDTAMVEKMLEAGYTVDELCKILTTYVANHTNLIYHEGDPRVARALNASRADTLLAIANGEDTPETRRILRLDQHPTLDIGGGKYNRPLLDNLGEIF